MLTLPVCACWGRSPQAVHSGVLSLEGQPLAARIAASCPQAVSGESSVRLSPMRLTREML